MSVDYENKNIKLGDGDIIFGWVDYYGVGSWVIKSEQFEKYVEGEIQ